MRREFALGTAAFVSLVGAAPIVSGDAAQPSIEFRVTEPVLEISPELEAFVTAGVGKPVPSDRRIRLGWANGDIQSDDGRVWSFQGYVELAAGEALPVDNSVLTMMDLVGGKLDIETDAGTRSWDVHPGNFKNYAPKSQVMDDGRRAFVVPMRLINGGQSLGVRLSVAYALQDGQWAFRKSWLYGEGFGNSGRSNAETLEAITAAAPAVALQDPDLPRLDHSWRVTASQSSMVQASQAWLMPGYRIERCAIASDRDGGSHEPWDTRHCVVLANFQADDPLAGSVGLALSIRALPGPSVDTNGAVVGTFESADGVISTFVDGVERTTPFVLGYWGDRIATTRYDPTSAELQIRLPVRFDTGDRSSTYGSIEVTCRVASAANTCEPGATIELRATKPVRALFAPTQPWAPAIEPA